MSRVAAEPSPPTRATEPRPAASGAPKNRQPRTGAGSGGDEPPRGALATAAVRHCPVFLEPVFLTGIAAWRFATRPADRRNAAHQLAGTAGRRPGKLDQLRAFRTFLRSAQASADLARAGLEGDFVDWEFVGADETEQLADIGGGAVLATARIDRFELAEAALAERCGRPVASIWDPDREWDDIPSSGDFAIAMSMNAAVAMRADAPAPGQPAVPGELFGQLVRIPKAPFEFARDAGVPVFPVFAVRLGWRRYQLRVEPPFEVGGSIDEPGTGIHEAAIRWTQALSSVLRRFPHHWHRFEQPVFPDLEPEADMESAREQGPDAAPGTRATGSS